MAEIGNKRKATRALEEATKRMRIETIETPGMPLTDKSNAILKILIGIYRSRSFRSFRGQVK